MDIAELFILAMIAGFILLQLRRELGKKPDDDYQQDPHQMRDVRGPAPQEEPVYVQPAADDPVIALEANPVLRKAWKEIRAADGSFTPSIFLEGARSAYTMILESYWQGDKSLLKDFLDDDLYAQFAGAIDSRADEGVVMDNQLLDITDVKVSEARMHGSSAEITVDVMADVRAVTRDSERQIIDGSETATVQYHDRWTFARNTQSDDPNWTLVATAAL